MLLTTIQFILLGAGVTIAVAAAALPMGLVLGLLLAVVRVYGVSWLRRGATVYSSAMRSVPPIVLLFIIYFLLSDIINISAFWAGVIGLGIISSSYQMEILRGSLQAVGSGQMIAARSIGMSYIQAIWHIILPQSLRLAIPPWSNEAAMIIKDSSLVYALGVQEVLRRAQFVSARTYQPFLAYGIAAAIYFLLIFAFNRMLFFAERKTRIPGL